MEQITIVQTQFLWEGLDQARNMKQLPVLCSLSSILLRLACALPRLQLNAHLCSSFFPPCPHQQWILKGTTVIWCGWWCFVFSAKRMKQKRKCEVTYAYSPMNEDELELAVGEIIEIIREVESPLANAQTSAFELIAKSLVSLWCRHTVVRHVSLWLKGCWSKSLPGKSVSGKSRVKSEPLFIFHWAEHLTPIC